MDYKELRAPKDKFIPYVEPKHIKCIHNADSIEIMNKLVKQFETDDYIIKNNNPKLKIDVTLFKSVLGHYFEEIANGIAKQDLSDDSVPIKKLKKFKVPGLGTFRPVFLKVDRLRKIRKEFEAKSKENGDTL